MSSIGIALGLLSVWAVGLALVGFYWVKKELRFARSHKARQRELPFKPSDYVSIAEEHSVHS